MIISDYDLDGILINVAYSYTPSEDGDYLQPPVKGFAEILKVWIPTDQMKTDIMPLMQAWQIDEMEDFFYCYETDKLYEL